MMKFFPAALMYGVISVCGASVVVGCPLCLAPSQTWSEMIAEADVVVLARLVSRDEGSSVRKPSAVFEIVSIHKGQPYLPEKSSFRIEQFAFGDPGDQFLLKASLQDAAGPELLRTFATDDNGGRLNGVKRFIRKVAGVKADRQSPGDEKTQELVWDSPEAVSPAAWRYVTEAPQPEMPARERLAYFLTFLENDDSLIAIDAWGEFAMSEYKDIKALRHLFSAPELRKWIASERANPECLSLYGLMLGMCGEPADAAFLRQHIGPPDGELKAGIEGFMGGLLVLDGENGLAFLEQTRLHDPSVSEFEAYAVVQALQFIWNHERTAFDPDRLRIALHPLLQRDSLREVVIVNLSRWEDWTLVPKLAAVYDDCRTDDPGTTRAIVGYLLTWRKSAADRGVDQKTIATAENLLQRIRSENARLVWAVEREVQ